VDDRRGRSVATAGGIGLGGLVIIGLITLLMGGNPSDVIEMAGQMMVNQDGTTTTTQDWNPSAEEQALATFSKQIIAGTEDVWTKIFEAMGRTYIPPKLVLYSGTVQSGCGNASSQMGPFYCSADQSVYIDLSFFMSMKQQLGADGDFAYAYVLAHEVGHHVQALLGTLQQAHNKMSRVSKTESNQISVRLELQADFYAGIWAYYDNKFFGSIEPGDVEEGIKAAQSVGDDLLQKKSYGRTVPDSFTHGTAEQRSRWLKKGLTTGNINLGDTFSPAYNAL
jgi:predicted metalloprotease